MDASQPRPVRPRPRPPDLLTTCAQIAEVLPAAAAFSHFTAAQLHGCWLPRLPSWLPVMATLAPGAIRPERRGLYVARSRALAVSPDTVEGLPVVGAAHVLGQLAADLGLIDLVVAIDSLLQTRRCTVEDVETAIRSRQRGLPMLRRALLLCDARSESAWETILRLLHVVSDIAVEPQYAVRDEAGGLVARGDLHLTGTRRLAEYDGADHRDRRQHELDLARDKRLLRLGWQRYGYIAAEVLRSPERIIRDAEQASGLRHDPHRLDEWHWLVSQSTLTWDGKRRLLRRLHRYARPLRGRAKPQT